MVCANGKSYGKGAYFARDASYSDSNSYSPPDPACHGLKHLLLNLIIVGETCQGHPQMVRPGNSTRGDGSLCECAVDNPVNPSIYVTFETSGAMAYPLYTVAYKWQNLQENST